MKLVGTICKLDRPLDNWQIVQRNLQIGWPVCQFANWQIEQNIYIYLLLAYLPVYRNIVTTYTIILSTWIWVNVVHHSYDQYLLAHGQSGMYSSWHRSYGRQNLDNIDCIYDYTDHKYCSYF